MMTYAAVLGLLCLAIPLLCSGPLLIRKRRPKPSGRYVAEVWLEWEVCRGSTLYRQRFRSRTAAWLFVRWHALSLDLHLPRYYWDTDWSGRRVRYAYEYGLFWGVRKATSEEMHHGVSAIWSPALPGTKAYRGEHASAHPWEREQLSGDSAGFKL